MPMLRFASSERASGESLCRSAAPTLEERRPQWVDCMVHSLGCVATAALLWLVFNLPFTKELCESAS